MKDYQLMIYVNANKNECLTQRVTQAEKKVKDLAMETNKVRKRSEQFEHKFYKSLTMKKFVDMLKITYETKLKIVQEKLSRKSPILVT